MSIRNLGVERPTEPVDQSRVNLPGWGLAHWRNHVQDAIRADNRMGQKSRVATTWPAPQCYTDRGMTATPAAQRLRPI